MGLIDMLVSQDTFLTQLDTLQGQQLSADQRLQWL